jgi:hypothetical protein
LWLAVGLTLALTNACAPKPVTLPSGEGTAFPSFAEPLAAATASCRTVSSITAELGLEGRVGSTKLRGRALVGAAAPDSIRLEALAPFGPPVFVLAAERGRATLLLPRDDRVLRDTPADQVVEALTGVRIDPGSLRSALAGCGVGIQGAVAARSYGARWLALETGTGQTLFLEQVAGAWRVRGARTDAFTITYDELGPVQPTRLTIRASGAVSAEIRLRLSQVEVNVPLGAEAFRVDVPAEAVPLTLEELRDAGPLGEKRDDTFQ